tara:strand:- start:15180 stop:15428 length:249 start_codon:yes stop_codon:yes gene_type:complete
MSKMQAYELNFDSTDFESFNDRKGRVATLPWKTTDEFFVIKTQQEMKEGKGRPSAPPGWNTRAVKDKNNPQRCGYHCFRSRH